MRAVLLCLMLVPGAARANDVTTFSFERPIRLKPTNADKCHNARLHFAAKPAQPLRAKRLEDEPAANAYLPVLRLKDGCDVPVLVGENVSGGADAGH